MAIGTPVSLGTNTSSTGAAFNISTGATTPSGALLICVMHYWDTTRPSDSSWTVSGGGLTWQQDAHLTDNDGTDDAVGTVWWSAPAPSGLASATSITITPTNVTGANAELLYCDGLETAAARTDSGSAHTNDETNTGTWTTGAGTLAASSALLVAGAMVDAAGASTIGATAPATELAEVNDATHGWRSSTNYLIASSSGSKTIDGTRSGGDFGCHAGWIAYIEPAGPPPPAPDIYVVSAAARLP